MEKKTRQHTKGELKRGYSLKMRPSIVKLAKGFIAKDPDIKSFNHFLELATVDYITKKLKDN